MCLLETILRDFADSTLLLCDEEHGVRKELKSCVVVRSFRGLSGSSFPFMDGVPVLHTSVTVDYYSSSLSFDVDAI